MKLGDSFSPRLNRVSFSPTPPCSTEPVEQPGGEYLSPEYVEREERLGIQEHLSWLCRHCGEPVTIEAVVPSRDGTYELTLWTCQPCQVWAVTPSDLQAPPDRRPGEATRKAL
jgi:hypothetical protein